MENMTLYQKILESNLINFIIMVLLLALIYKKANLGAILDKMATDIREKVMTSAQAAQDALNEYKEAKKSARNVSVDKEKILNQAKENAKNIENKINEDINKECKNLDEKFKKTQTVNIQKAKESVVNDIYNAIIEQTKLTVSENLDKDTQKLLINKCIEELDTLEEIKL